MISVMTVSRQEKNLDTIRQYISKDEELELAAESPGGDGALDRIDNTSPDILLVCSNSTDGDAISLAERIIRRKPRTFVILILEELSLEALQIANEAGCHNVIEFPDNAQTLCDYIHKVYNNESGRLSAVGSSQSVTWSSKVISVYGAKGGLGKTTIAVNLAVKLAAMNRKVALVDLDLHLGDVHIFMDIDPKETISDLMQDMVTPSIDSIRSYMNMHSSGVQILCAPRSPEYADLVAPDRLQTLIGILRSGYDFVILDLPSDFSDTTLSALEASSLILFITGLDISILKNSKVTMNILESLGQKSKVRTIINRAVEMNSILISDVQQIVDAPILARIPSDYMTAVVALNRGQPFVQSMPRSKLSMAIGDVALKLGNGEDSFDIRQLTPAERRALIRKYRTKEKYENKRSSLFKKSI